jgi:hypothetical protein
VTPSAGTTAFLLSTDDKSDPATALAVELVWASSPPAR